MKGGIVADLPSEQVKEVARVKSLQALPTTTLSSSSCCQRRHQRRRHSFLQLLLGGSPACPGGLLHLLLGRRRQGHGRMKPGGHWTRRWIQTWWLRLWLGGPWWRSSRVLWPWGSSGGPRRGLPLSEQHRMRLGLKKIYTTWHFAGCGPGCLWEMRGGGGDFGVALQHSPPSQLVSVQCEVCGEFCLSDRGLPMWLWNVLVQCVFDRWKYKPTKMILKEDENVIILTNHFVPLVYISNKTLSFLTFLSTHFPFFPIPPSLIVFAWKKSAGCRQRMSGTILKEQESLKTSIFLI